MSDLAPLYVIVGTDRGKVRRAVARLRARIEGESGSIEQHDLTAVEELVAVALSFSLLPGPRLLLIEETDDARASDLATALPTYLTAPTPDTVIAVVGDAALAADHALGALPGAAVLHYGLPDGKELAAYARAEAERLGARFEPDALRALLDRCVGDPIRLGSEIDKLATYAAGAPIDAGAIDDLAFSGGAADTPFALTDAVSARARRRAFRVLARAERGSTPATVGQLARHMQLLVAARRAFDAGEDHRAFAKRVGIHEFRARKLLEAVGAWSADELTRAVAALADADHAGKGGSRLDAGFSLELALARGL